MKLKSFLFYISAVLVVLFTGCDYDNFEYPESTLSGNITYNGQPLSLKSGGVSSAFQLEAWQRGFGNFSKIAIFIDQNGHYSSKLFDGDYKIVRLKGSFPWVDDRDSINVTVKGNTTLDVPVSPYFMLSNVSYVKNAATSTAAASVTVTFTVVRTYTEIPPIPAKTVDVVRLCIGQTIITDDTNNAGSGTKAGSTITLGTPTTLTVNVPTTLATKPYIYVRTGVKTTGFTELIYSAPQKIELP